MRLQKLLKGKIKLLAMAIDMRHILSRKTLTMSYRRLRDVETKSCIYGGVGFSRALFKLLSRKISENSLENISPRVFSKKTYTERRLHRK